MNLLVIDTSSSFLQLRVKSEQKTLTYTFQQTKGTSNSHLARAVSFLCEQAQINPADLQLIIGSAGPGSFTGLRIGMAFIKGLVCALKIPFVFVNILDALAQPYGEQKTPILSVTDGKKGRLYACLYAEGSATSPYWDLAPEDLREELQRRNVVSVNLVGNYAPAFREAFPAPRASLVPNFLDTLQGLEVLGLSQYKEKGSNPLGASLFYLRESDAEASLLVKP